MKIAITADCHLDTKHLERKEVLKKIFEKIMALNINNLCILGDLFDKTQQNYSEFDELLKEFPHIQVYLIPGNHDYNISSAYFISSNLKVITEPSFFSFNGMNFLFVPYNREKESIGEIVREEFHKKDKKETKNWVLLSHGDYITTSYNPNPYEDSRIYMPLDSLTVERFQPEKVFLGHIHKPSEYGKIFYPGSPCPVDPTESGKRSFLIFDTEDFECERVVIDTPYIYFKNEIIVYPVENELELLEERLKIWLSSLELSSEDYKKVKLFLSVKGFTNDKKRLQQMIEKFFQEEKMEIKELNLTDVSVPDMQQSFSDIKTLWNKVKELLENLDKKIDGIELSQDEIEKKILEKIFGKKG